MSKNKKSEEIDWDEGIIDKMPIEKQERIAKKFEAEIIKLKQTLAGRRRLAKAFGRTPAYYKP
jgi:hypothetical protein